MKLPKPRLPVLDADDRAALSRLLTYLVLLVLSCAAVLTVAAVLGLAVGLFIHLLRWVV